MNYFWKSKFWIFPDSHNFASATPKMRDGGDGGRNFYDLIGNSKSQFSMRITNSTILSRSGPRMAEISTISSKIRNLNFRWESRIRQFCVDLGRGWWKFRRSHRKFEISIFERSVLSVLEVLTIGVFLWKWWFSSKTSTLNLRQDLRDFCYRRPWST